MTTLIANPVLRRFEINLKDLHSINAYGISLQVNKLKKLNVSILFSGHMIYISYLETAYTKKQLQKIENVFTTIEYSFNVSVTENFN